MKMQQQQAVTTKEKLSNASMKPNSVINNKLNSKMLEAFWKLPEYKSSTRLEGISQICRYFATLDPALNQESYNYVLVRLIKGLASNRKCSRLGFSCALTELLNNHDSLKFEYVIELARKHLSYSNDSKKVETLFTKEEIRHMQIGLVFVYLCWIQSNRVQQIINSNNFSILSKVLAELNSTRKNKEYKGYIQQLFLQALVLLVKKVEKPEVFTKTVLPVIENDLKEVWTQFESADKTSSLLKDNLNLLLSCANSYSNEMSSFFKSSQLKLAAIISSKNFDYFHDILSQSSESLPNLQPICMELLQYLALAQPDLFRSFWINLIDLKLLSRKETEKKYLAYKLFLFSLNLVDEANYEILFNETLYLSNNLIQNLVNSYTNKMNTLNPLSRDIVKELIEIIKDKEAKLKNVSIGASLMMKSIGYARNFHDLSDFVSPLVFVLNDNGLVKFYDYLINEVTVNEREAYKDALIDAKLQKKEDEDGKEANGQEEGQNKLDTFTRKQLWVLNQVSNLSKNALTFDNSALLKKILNYLAFHSYFEATSETDTHGPLVVKNEKVEGHLRETLLQYVGILLSKDEKNSASVLISLIKYIEDLLEKSKSSGEIKLDSKLEKHHDKLKKNCTTVLKLLGKIASASAAQNGKDAAGHESVNKDVLQTFLLTTSIECFRMFDTFKNSQQTIEDLEICYENFVADLSKANVKNGKHKKKMPENEEDEGKFVFYFEINFHFFGVPFFLNNIYFYFF